MQIAGEAGCPDRHAGQGQIFPIREERGIRPQIRGDFLRLVLKHGRATGQQAVIMLKRKLNGLVERDLGRARGWFGPRPDSEDNSRRRPRTAPRFCQSTAKALSFDAPRLQGMPPAPGADLSLSRSIHRT